MLNKHGTNIVNSPLHRRATQGGDTPPLRHAILFHTARIRRLTPGRLEQYLGHPTEAHDAGLKALLEVEQAITGLVTRLSQPRRRLPTPTRVAAGYRSQ